MKNTHKQENSPIGGAVRNATSLIPQRLSSSSIIPAITCSENIHAWPCIDSHGRVDRDNSTTPAIYVMQRSISRNRNQPSTYRVNDGRSTWAPIFRGQGAKMANRLLHKRKLSYWITISKTVNSFRIDWSVIEKSRREHDPKWTCLCDLLLNGSSHWRHFRGKCKTTEGYALLNFEAASISAFREN